MLAEIPLEEAALLASHFKKNQELTRENANVQSQTNSSFPPLTYFREAEEHPTVYVWDTYYILYTY